jgi:predicted  nucleic acid-binding Zn-ribbon protein
LESDDALATAHAEIKRLNHLNAQLDVRLHGLMNERNEAVKLCKKLQKENDKLHEWCLEWRTKYDKLEEKTNGLRNLVADQAAIICYIESKLFKSVKEGSNVKNNINS